MPGAKTLARRQEIWEISDGRDRKDGRGHSGSNSKGWGRSGFKGIINNYACD